jgi:chain length determinant protein EpsF
MMDLRVMLAVLYRRRWLVLTLFTAAVICAIAATFVMPRQFKATSVVVIDNKADPLVGAADPEQSLPSYLATQLDIAGSLSVAERAVRLLKLDEDPSLKAEWQKNTEGRGDFLSSLADSMRKQISITPARDSNVIEITATYPNAQFAAKLANAYARAYIDATLDLKIEPAKQNAAWFDQRSRELRATLEEKQKLLADYRTETGITDTDDHSDLEMTRLSEVSSTLTKLESQRQDAEAVERQIESDPANSEQALHDPSIASLKANLATVETKLRSAALTMGVNNPAYQSLKAEAQSASDALAAETARLVDAARASVAVYASQEAQTRADLERQKKEVLDLRIKRDRVSLLQKDVADAQRSLDEISQRLSLTNLQSQMQQTNVILLSGATEPAAPSAPRPLVNLLVGIFMGLVLGFGVPIAFELASPRIRTSEQMARLLSVPLLSEISAHKLLATDTARTPRLLAQR